MVFKHAFKEKFSKFILLNLKYLIIGLLGICISYVLISLIPLNISNAILNLIVLFAINGVITVGIVMICFMFDKFFRETFKKYCNVMLRMLKRA